MLDLPELKISKPSDTRWLAHERCVKAVKASYAAIVVALDNINENTREPEALGLRKSLSKCSTVAAMYMLDYILPQVAKLSKTLQTEHLNLLIIPSFVHLKDNISSQFASSSDVVSAISIFDPKKMPSVESPDLHRYGVDHNGTLLSHYVTDKLGQTSLGEPTVKKALISSEIHTERISYR